MSYFKVKRGLGASGTVKHYGTSGVGAYTGPSTVTVTSYKDPYDTALLESRSVTAEELKLRNERIALLERIAADVRAGKKPPELSAAQWNSIQQASGPAGSLMRSLQIKLLTEWPTKLKSGALPYAVFIKDGKRLGRFYGSVTGYKGVIKEVPEPKNAFEIIGEFLGDVATAVVNAVKAIIDKACGLVNSGAGSTVLTVTGPTGAAVQQTAAFICGNKGVIPEPPPEEPKNYLPIILIGGAALAAFIILR